MEATMASTFMEESGVGLVAMRSFESVEEGKCFFQVTARGEHAHLLEKIMMLGVEVYGCLSTE